MQDDQEPGELLRQRLGAERLEQCGHVLRLAHDDEPDRKDEEDDANTDEFGHSIPSPPNKSSVRLVRQERAAHKRQSCRESAAFPRYVGNSAPW